jgi:PAS domain S-box-containing protein
MENTADEIRRLQRCVNDLISVLALPALWGGSESSHMVGTLLDVLLAMLRLDFAYARVSDSSDGRSIEMVRSAHRRQPSLQPHEVGQALGRCLTGDPTAARFVIPNPAGEGEISIASFSLGLQDEVGVLVAGSRRSDFPTDIERLLLRVAANQAGIGLQEARRSGEQRRVAEALEHRVAERTGQLTAINEELRLEIEDRKRAEMLLAGEKRLLVMIAGGDSRALILDALCRLVEELVSGSLSSILLLDPKANRLRHGAAPSLPTKYTEAIDGAAIGPSAGSCGTAAYRAEPVIVSDIVTDPLWADYRDLASAHGLRACWSTPILSSEGRVLGTFAIYYRQPRSPTPQEHDVIEQITHLASIAIERAQAAEAQLRLGAIVESSDDAIISKTLQGVITGWNVSAQRIFGYAAEEVVGRPINILIPPDRQYEELDILERLRRGESVRHFETVRIRKDGGRIHVSLAISPIKDANGMIIGVSKIARDITERKRAESELRESERRHRYIFQATGVSIWEQDFSHVKMAIDDLQAGGVQDFREYFAAHPEFVQQAITMVKVVDVNDVTVRLFAAESKDELMVSLHKILLPETLEVFVGELIAVAEGRTSFEAETVLQTLKGERLTVLFTMTFPSPPAGFDSVLLTVTDITERKLAEAERARLGQRLRQAEKMEAVGRLAGGIAHDFNNVLGGILAYGEMLFEEAPGSSPLKRYAQNVLTAATRGRALVEQILAYSRSQRGKRAPTDMCRTVAETLELVRGSLPANIYLDASTFKSPLVVIGDATQLHQVVMNLCSNAVQAMSAGGTLRVALEPAGIEAERALSHGTLRAGHYVRLTIEDSGSGMDEGTLSRIFEPFFTTKEVGRGTGLGLSLVDAIVADLAGAIDVTSALERGSTFAIYLPLVEVAIAAVTEAEGPLPRGHGERVLVVDDEQPFVALTAEMLSRLGYEPVSFCDSHDALAAFEAAPARFDVVVTDALMPGLTGTTLASMVRRRRPDLPIVLVSAYSGPILTQQALAAGVSELLTKPLQSREIATTLARVLHPAA